MKLYRLAVIVRLAAMSLLLLGGLFASGCGAGDGGVCQLDGDCSAGLVCTCKLGGGVDARGICRATATAMCTVTTVDANIPDTGPRDAGSDAFTPDTSADDASLVDANADGGARDTGVDAPTATDGGSDAGDDASTADANVDAG